MLVSACAHDRRCGAAARADFARTRRLAAFIGRAPTGPVCYVPGRGAAVLVGDRAELDANLPDRELAAQLAHVDTHRRDRLGDGCARGLDAALASEAHARTVEAEVRARLGLPAPEGHPDATRDYEERCAAVPRLH